MLPTTIRRDELAKRPSRQVVREAQLSDRQRSLWSEMALRRQDPSIVLLRQERLLQVLQVRREGSQRHTEAYPTF